ncbi:hypothetical protein RUND412_010245 [Rhizina undulata]
MVTKIIPPLEHVPPANNQLPYPVTPPEPSPTESDWSKSSDGEFELGGLEEALEPKKVGQKQQEGPPALPDILQAGVFSKQEPQQHGTRKINDADIPSSLKVGEGVVRSSMFPIGSAMTTGSPQQSTVVGAREERQAAALSQLDKGKGPEILPPSDTCSPITMTANLTTADRPFYEYSTSYHPNEVYPPGPVGLDLNSHAPNPYVNPSALTNQHSPPENPPVVPPQSSHSQFVPSSVSSTGFEPIADISSFDASDARALPGQRGAPQVGMDGWAAEPDVEVTKTWEEELDLRAKAGAEIQRRAEEAQQKEREERIQAAFWEEERKHNEMLAAQTTGSTQVPPKSAKDYSQEPRQESVDAPLIDVGDSEKTEKLFLPPQGSSPPKVTDERPLPLPPATEKFLPPPGPPPPAILDQRPLPFPAIEQFLPPPGPPPPAVLDQRPLPSQATEQFLPPPGPPPPPARDQRSLPPPPPITRPSPQPSAATTTEIYQIKHITWADPRCTDLRHSPILLQNLNGPCPLLALINALILATPPGMTTSLVEALSHREQVSLELLLDTVFEELMSRKSTDLPDVGDLFAFLLTLHTGMNVNPKLTPQIVNGKVLPGGFERTREMDLYGAFRVPLFHGWLPDPENPVIEAMIRRKLESYEEAQTIIWQEEEIIDRLSLQGGDLSPEDQALMQDSGRIRDFLENTRTQLTSFGLETLRTGMLTGEVAILFRNDHFMTVYKESKGGLMALVTDMGYAGHEEIIWERIVDVNGFRNEFCSGDFRPVGGDGLHEQRPAQSLVDAAEGGEWETVQRRRSSRHSQNQNSPNQNQNSVLNPPPGPSELPHIGEDSTDYDLALALQLQEEEDEHHRRLLANPPQPSSSNPPQLPPRNQHQFRQPPPAPPRNQQPPPPYERHPNVAPTVASQNMSAYQQQAAQVGETAQRELHRRAGQARGLLQEIAGSSGHRRGYSQPVGRDPREHHHSNSLGTRTSSEADKEKCLVM